VIITESDLLDRYRDWYNSKYYYAYTQKGTLNPHCRKPHDKIVDIQSLALKFIDCYICVSFWSGILLWILNFSPYENPLLSGIAAVGLVSVLKLLTNKKE
jgi:hypothetical protein